MCCRESGHHPLAVVMAPGRSARGTCESLGGVKIAATGLGDRFPHAVEVLNEYFRRDRMTSWLPRLNEIFSVTEAAWERNVNRFDNKPIEHLLIAEAAPWTQPGDPPRYFYETLDGSWAGRVLKVFFDSRPPCVETALSCLAKRGFLLVDTLPFSLIYTTKIRKSPVYLELLKASQDYFYTKLRAPRLKWSGNVKIALAFNWPGRRAIEAYPDGIEVQPNLRLTFDTNQIAADGSGYTSAKYLRDIWGLPE